MAAIAMEAMAAEANKGGFDGEALVMDAMSMNVKAIEGMVAMSAEANTVMTMEAMNEGYFNGCVDGDGKFDVYECNGSNGGFNGDDLIGYGFDRDGNTGKRVHHSGGYGEWKRLRQRKR